VPSGARGASPSPLVAAGQCSVPEGEPFPQKGECSNPLDECSTKKLEHSPKPTNVPTNRTEHSPKTLEHYPAGLEHSPTVWNVLPVRERLPGQVEVSSLFAGAMVPVGKSSPGADETFPRRYGDPPALRGPFEIPS
jgi:hypothetical protein